MNFTRSRRHILFLLAPAALLLLAVAGSGVAAPIEDYRRRVEGASALALQLEKTLANSEVDHTLSRQLVARIRQDFPQSERIEWDGGSSEISNEWLLARVSDFEKEAESTKRREYVSAIREHLSSLNYKIEEIDYRDEETRSKDEDKRKLGEILRREEYQKPVQAEESAIQRWLRDVLEWFMDLWPKPSGASQPATGFGNLASVLRILLYVVLAAVVGFLLYKIVPLLLPGLKREPRSKKKKSRVILGEQIEDDMAAADLFSEAERLARDGDLRAAIRKGYIALLCDLSDRRIIGLARSKTNRDYLRDVRSRRDLHTRMKSATDMFERHWYGFQESEPQDWTRFSEEYREAIKSA